MNIEHLAAGFGTPGSARRAAVRWEGDAWQHQLQRAQSAGWFMRADELSAREANATGPSARTPVRPVTGEWKSDAGSRVTTAPPSLFSARAGTAAFGDIAPGVKAVPAGSYSRAPDYKTVGYPEASTIPTSGFPAPEVHQQGSAVEEGDGPERRPATPSAPAKRDAPANRIHVEEGRHGLQVWLGLDGTADEVAARVGAVVADLRRQCGRAGVRLADVTCNGVSVGATVPAPIRNGKET